VFNKGKTSIEDASEGTDMFGRAQSSVSDRLKDSVQTLASVTQGSAYYIPFPAVVVVTPAAAALTAPIQRQLASEVAADRNVWSAIRRTFTEQLEHSNKRR
jgi:hypothetical protein